MRLIGRAEWGGSASEQLERALEEIHYTFVRTRFKSADRFVEHSFNIFPEIYVERREHATDPIEACTVTLARPIMASLQDGHFTCLNHGLMQQLGTIGQALYMRLFFHFANLYDGHHNSRLSFSKRYDDICAEWLGGLLVLKYQSNIEQEQLGLAPAPARAEPGSSLPTTSPKPRLASGFVITFRPGSAFFTDYDRFYRAPAAGEYPVRFSRRPTANRGAAQGRVSLCRKAQRPRQCRHPYVPSKDVETAKYLLSRLPFEDIPDFLDYALAEAKKTSFDVQTLGGLKQYLSRYQERRTQRATAKATEARREAEARPLSGAWITTVSDARRLTGCFQRLLVPGLGLSPPPWLGVTIDSGSDIGVTVEHVVRGSPADKGGVKAGDRIVGIDSTQNDRPHAGHARRRAAQSRRYRRGRTREARDRDHYERRPGRASLGRREILKMNIVGAPAPTWTKVVPVAGAPASIRIAARPRRDRRLLGDLVRVPAGCCASASRLEERVRRARARRHHHDQRHPERPLSTPRTPDALRHRRRQRR